MLFLIIFISPAYLAVQQKWGAFAVNLVLYILAWATILIFGLGIVFWALGLMHAMWHFRTQAQREQAVMIATETVKAQAIAAEVAKAAAAEVAKTQTPPTADHRK